jgi:hypothetical protein
MKVLLIHQKFLGQYKHLGPALVRRGDQVFALTPKVKKRMNWHSVDIFPYKITGQSSKDIHPWLVDLQAKVLRAESCYNAAVDLQHQGLMPDVILAHHGWGEPMFLNDVWPEAKVAIYCEFYHSSKLAAINFYPEFPIHHLQKEPIRLIQSQKSLSDMCPIPHTDDVIVCGWLMSLFHASQAASTMAA